MPQTSVYKLRYPNLSDSPNVPSDMKNLADDAERSLVEVNGRIQSSGSSGGNVTPNSIYWKQYTGGGNSIHYQMHAWRSGRIASIQGVIQRATKSFDPTTKDPATGRLYVDIGIPVAVLPWNAQYSQLGLTLGSFSGVYKTVRWTISAGTNKILIFRAPSFGPNDFININDWISLNFVYNTVDIPNVSGYTPPDPEIPDPEVQPEP